MPGNAVAHKKTQTRIAGRLFLIDHHRRREADVMTDHIDDRVHENGSRLLGALERRKRRRSYRTRITLGCSIEGEDGTRFMIHEMMHSLGQRENPPTAGQPTSAQLNQQVSAACGH
jgi:hypothetical protein